MEKFQDVNIPTYQHTSPPSYAAFCMLGTNCPNRAFVPYIAFYTRACTSSSHFLLSFLSFYIQHCSQWLCILHIQYLISSLQNLKKGTSVFYLYLLWPRYTSLSSSQHMHGQWAVHHSLKTLETGESYIHDVRT